MPIRSVRVVLLRHGQTSWNAERRILGRTDVPLDAEGRAQAERVGPALLAAGHRLDAVWTSPLARARETAVHAAQVAARVGDTLRVEPDLVEMDQGSLEGLPAADLVRDHAELLAAWRADPGAVVLPGGERMQAVQARGRAAIERIVAEVRGGAAAGEGTPTVLVVSHQLLIGAVLCGVVGAPLAAWRSYSHRNTAWSELLWGEDGPPRLVAHDVGPHLDALVPRAG